uniref:Beta_elim_lyase domain-containing protein n=1 Tax=Macrostomum lignano TaxID=282301 RepID=A0A1I8GW98_9PLAT
MLKAVTFFSQTITHLNAPSVTPACLISFAKRLLSYQYNSGEKQKHRQTSISDDAGARIVDFRSDVLSKPTPGMMKAMIESVSYGDDVFGENTTVMELESRVAKMLGQEAGLFVTSGTMGNLLPVMSHCRERGSEVILGDLCHIHLYEQGSLASFAGAHHRAVSTNPNGTLCLEQCRRLIRTNAEDPHYPITRALCLENTHGLAGGKVLPVAYFAEARELCNRYGMKLHVDGARLINAAVALGIDPIEYGRYVSSVTICFSKGLGAPVGSCIASDADTISYCRRIRKALGGAARQPGLLAAAASYSLDVAKDTLSADHANAQLIYSGVSQVNLPDWLVFEKPQTNVMQIKLTKDAPISIDQLQTIIEEPTDSCKIRLRAPAVSETIIRLLTHNDLTRQDCLLAVEKLKYALQNVMSALTPRMSGAIVCLLVLIVGVPVLEAVAVSTGASVMEEESLSTDRWSSDGYNRELEWRRFAIHSSLNAGSPASSVKVRTGSAITNSWCTAGLIPSPSVAVSGRLLSDWVRSGRDSSNGLCLSFSYRIDYGPERRKSDVDDTAAVLALLRRSSGGSGFGSSSQSCNWFNDIGYNTEAHWKLASIADSDGSAATAATYRTSYCAVVTGGATSAQLVSARFVSLFIASSSVSEGCMQFSYQLVDRQSQLQLLKRNSGGSFLSNWITKTKESGSPEQQMCVQFAYKFIGSPMTRMHLALLKRSYG